VILQVSGIGHSNGKILLRQDEANGPIETTYELLYGASSDEKLQTVHISPDGISVW
jgi:hypothetical protein